MSRAVPGNFETSWERLAYHPDGVVQKGLRFADEHKAATAVGGLVVGLSTLAATSKYRWLSRHGVFLGILAGTAYATYLLAEESVQDLHHRSIGWGIAKGIGGLTAVATFIDAGSYYLRESLEWKTIPHIKALNKPLDFIMRNKASIGGVMIAGLGLSLLGSSLFDAITNRPPSVPYYNREFEDQPARGIVTASKGLLGFLGATGGIEILSLAQDWSFRPFTAIFGGKVGKTLVLGAAVVVGLVGAVDAMRRTYGTNGGFWNDSLATVEQFGSGFGVSAAFAGLGIVHGKPTLANLMARGSSIGRRVPLGLGLIATGGTFLKLAYNRWDSDDMTQNGWNTLSGGLGGVLAVAGSYEMLNLLDDSDSFPFRSLLGIGGAAALTGSFLFFARSYQSLQQGEVTDGLANAGLGIVSGAAGLSLWGEAFHLPYLDRLANKINQHLILPVLSGIARNPIASGVAAIAALAALYYFARGRRTDETKRR